MNFRSMVVPALALTLATAVLYRPAPPIGETVSASARVHSEESRTATYRPRVIGPRGEAAEVPNSFRGQYAWLGQAAQPAGWPTTDVYYRDQVPWGRIEPTAGSFDLRWFEAGLEAAQQSGGRFGFRVLAYCPGCWFDDATPSFVPLQPGTDIPDWNSEAFLSGWERLMGELGTRYDDDPRMGWVDVGGYGAWGEGHVSSGQKISDANAARVVRAVITAFPSKHVVLNAMDPRHVLAAMRANPQLGLRVDCLGEVDMFSVLATSPEMQERWKTAPVLSEWCGTPTTSTVLGARQVRDFHISQVSSGNLKPAYPDRSAQEQRGFRAAALAAGFRYEVRKVTVPKRIGRGDKLTVVSRWRNSGSAPTYDDWDVVLQVRDARGETVATRPLGVQLGRLLPGKRTYSSKLRLPRLPEGRYRLALSVVDPAGYLAPMNLAIQGRRADGSYPVGKVRVTR